MPILSVIQVFLVSKMLSGFHYLDDFGHHWRNPLTFVCTVRMLIHELESRMTGVLKPGGTGTVASARAPRGEMAWMGP